VGDLRPVEAAGRAVLGTEGGEAALERRGDVADGQLLPTLHRLRHAARQDHRHGFAARRAEAGEPHAGREAEIGVIGADPQPGPPLVDDARRRDGELEAQHRPGGGVEHDPLSTAPAAGGRGAPLMGDEAVGDIRLARPPDDAGIIEPLLDHGGRRTARQEGERGEDDAEPTAQWRPVAAPAARPADPAGAARGGDGGRSGEGHGAVRHGPGGTGGRGLYQRARGRLQIISAAGIAPPAPLARRRPEGGPAGGVRRGRGPSRPAGSGGAGPRTAG